MVGATHVQLRRCTRAARQCCAAGLPQSRLRALRVGRGRDSVPAAPAALPAAGRAPSARSGAASLRSAAPAPPPLWRRVAAPAAWPPRTRRMKTRGAPTAAAAPTFRSCVWSLRRPTMRARVCLQPPLHALRACFQVCRNTLGTLSLRRREVQCG